MRSASAAEAGSSEISSKVDSAGGDGAAETVELFDSPSSVVISCTRRRISVTLEVSGLSWPATVSLEASSGVSGGVSLAADGIPKSLRLATAGLCGIDEGFGVPGGVASRSCSTSGCRGTKDIDSPPTTS